MFSSHCFEGAIKLYYPGVCVCVSICAYERVCVPALSLVVHTNYFKSNCRIFFFRTYWPLITLASPPNSSVVFSEERMTSCTNWSSTSVVKRVRMRESSIFRITEVLLLFENVVSACSPLMFDRIHRIFNQNQLCVWKPIELITYGLNRETDKRRALQYLLCCWNDWFLHECW